MKELFDKFLMYFCLTGIGTIAVVAFVRVTLPAAATKVCGAARKAKKVGPAVIIPILCVAGLIVYGSTKNNSSTNDPPAQTQMIVRPGQFVNQKVDRIASDVVEASPVQKIGQTTLQSVETADAPVVHALVRVEKWWRRGAYDDGQVLTFDEGWFFPYGTNHLTSIEVWASGAVYPSEKNPTPIAELVTKLSLAPHDTEVYMGRTTNNTYRIEWHNGHPNRDLNQTADASIELFRNGNVVVTENGVETEIPYGIPFEHDGFGQDDDWVRANFTRLQQVTPALTNAEEIISIGYANWVDQQVGVGLTNGLYKFTALFEDDPPECVNLRVGDFSVAVTNAGEYVFLLGKGFRYGLNVYPRDFTGIVYDASDDVGFASRAALGAVHPAVNNGHWTEDHGTIEIVVPNPMVPFAPVVSFVCWRPSLLVTPQNWQPSELNDEETFTAVVTDVPWFASPSYRWCTADAEVVSIDSPSHETTAMQCHFPEAYQDRPSLSLEVRFAGCALNSYYSFDSDGGDDQGGVSLTFSIPDVLFVNIDDDNDDGIADFNPPVNPSDDDVAFGQLKFHAPYATNGTIVIESIMGYDRGFGDHGLIYLDRACSQEVAEGTEFEISQDTSLIQPLYFNAATTSSSYPGVQIKARWRPETGREVVASGYTTIVMPIVEPICNETTNVVVSGSSHNFVLNPCGVGVGKEAYFKIDVNPDSFPDEKIVWSAEGGVEFVGGNTGRRTTVRGLTPGSARLKISMRDDDWGEPEFPLYVTTCTNIPIHVVIVSDGRTPAQTSDRISEMIAAANDIYAQVGMSFYLASVCTTNIPNAYRITEEDVEPDVWSHDRLTALRSNTGGVECYCIECFVDAEGDPMAVNGMTSSSGIVLVRDAPVSTLAHEIGHLCDARDIYLSDKRGSINLLPDKVRWDRTFNDWNGGCMGRGSAGARYYRFGLGMSDLISCLLMNGRRGVGDRHYDMTLGGVYGIRNGTNGSHVKETVPIGFLGNSGFKIPQCE